MFNKLHFQEEFQEAVSDCLTSHFNYKANLKVLVLGVDQ